MLRTWARSFRQGAPLTIEGLLKHMSTLSATDFLPPPEFADYAVGPPHEITDPTHSSLPRMQVRQQLYGVDGDVVSFIDWPGHHGGTPLLMAVPLADQTEPFDGPVLIARLQEDPSHPRIPHGTLLNLRLGNSESYQIKIKSTGYDLDVGDYAFFSDGAIGALGKVYKRVYEPGAVPTISAEGLRQWLLGERDYLLLNLKGRPAGANIWGLRQNTSVMEREPPTKFLGFKPLPLKDYPSELEPSRRNFLGFPGKLRPKS